jgi:hypothetical protein
LRPADSDLALRIALLRKQPVVFGQDTIGRHRQPRAVLGTAAEKRDLDQNQ